MTFRASIDGSEHDAATIVADCPTHVSLTPFRPPVDTIEDFAEPTPPMQVRTAHPSAHSGKTAVMHVSHSVSGVRRASPPAAPSWVAPSSRGWELESVPGCVITNASASPEKALTGDRFDQRVPPWAALLAFGSVLVAIIAAVSVLHVGPRRHARGDEQAAPRTKSESVAQPAALASPSPAAALPPIAEAQAEPQQVAYPHPATTSKPAPKPAAARTVNRAPVVKAPVAKKASRVEDDETTRALEALQKARLESASSFGE